MNLRKQLLIIVMMFFAGCVSVQIGPKPAEPATDVKFAPPPAPFEKIKIDEIDQAWKNSKNGNIISYRGVCNDPSDPNLEAIFQGMLDGLQSVKVESSQLLSYNNREALNSVVIGKLDGVVTKFEMMIFKKNNCNYTLTYVALPANFKTDLNQFKNFLQSFEAP